MTEKQTAWRQEISDVALETPGEFASILKNLDPAWILKALAATGKASMRRRKAARRASRLARARHGAVSGPVDRDARRPARHRTAEWWSPVGRAERYPVGSGETRP